MAAGRKRILSSDMFVPMRFQCDRMVVAGSRKSMIGIGPPQTLDFASLALLHGKEL